MCGKMAQQMLNERWQHQEESDGSSFSTPRCNRIKLKGRRRLTQEAIYSLKSANNSIFLRRVVRPTDLSLKIFKLIGFVVDL